MLIDEYYNSANAVDLQIAIWETVTEDSSNSYDLDSGTFIVEGHDTTTANTYLDYLNTTANPQLSGDYEFMVAIRDDGSSQPFIIPKVVPIPGAAWLLGAGLFGLIGFRRRFRSKE